MKLLKPLESYKSSGSRTEKSPCTEHGKTKSKLSLLKTLQANPNEKELVNKKHASRTKKILRKNLYKGRSIEEEISKLQHDVGELEVSCKNLDYQALSLQEEIDNQCARMGSYPKILTKKTCAKEQRLGRNDVSFMNRQIIERKLYRLQRRLEKYIQDYDSVYESNGCLKKAINDLRNERLVYHRVFTKLGNDLKVQKHNIKNAHTCIAEFYQLRDEALDKMVNVRDDFAHDRAAYKEEWQSLSIALDSQRENKEVISPPMYAFTRGNMSHKKETEIKGNVQKGQWKQGHLKQLAAKTGNRLKVLQAESKKLVTECNAVNLSELVENFIEMEDDNFTRYTSQNQLQVEVDGLRHDIKRIEGELNQYLGQEGSYQDKRQEIIKNLKSDIDKKKEVNTALKADIDKIISQIVSVCGTVEHAQNALMKKEEETKKFNITPDNILQSMGTLEVYCNEILNRYIVSVIDKEKHKQKKVINQIFGACSNESKDISLNRVSGRAMHTSISSGAISDYQNVSPATGEGTVIQVNIPSLKFPLSPSPKKSTDNAFSFEGQPNSADSSEKSSVRVVSTEELKKSVARECLAVSQ